MENYRSDGQGVVRVQWPKTRPQWLNVRVKSPDYVYQSKYWNQRPIKCEVPPETFEFKLVKGIPIGGVVSNGTVGIEGVEVHASIDSPSGNAKYVATTDKEGWWSILNAPSEISAIDLQLIHDDYCSDPNQWSRKIAASDIDHLRSEKFEAVLSKGQPLSGLVIDERGMPIEDVQLKLVSYVMTDHALTLRSDKQGRFQFPHCDPNLDSCLVAFHPLYAPYRIPVRLNGAPLTQDVVLRNGTPVRFRVAGPDRKPISGASLEFSQWHGVLNKFTWDDQFDKPVTDENGECVWNRAPDQPFAYGFYRQGWTHPRLENISPSIKPIEVQMLPEAIVTVRAVDQSSGETIQNFNIIIGKLRSERQLNRHDAVQTTTGQARRRIYDSDHQYFVRIEAPGFAPVESELHDIREGDLDLKFELKPTAQIEGIVCEPDGSPAKDAIVILGTKASRPYIRAGGITHNHDLQVKTSADGAFSFTDPGDDFTLFVFSKSGFAHLRKQDFKTPAEILVRPYARIEGQLYQTDTTDKYSDIKFEIEGQSGIDSPFGPYGYFDIQTKVDGHGKFTLELPGGIDGTLSATKIIAKRGPMLEGGSGPSQTMSLVAGKTYHVTLGQVGRRVVGRVRLDAQLQNCRVSTGTFSLASRIKGPFRPDVKAPTSHFRIDESGEFAIDGVPPGEYSIWIGAREEVDERVSSEYLGHLQRWVTIPPPNTGQAEDQTFDLGEFTIHQDARLQGSIGTSGRDYLKLPRTDSGAASFSVRIRCVDSNQRPVRAAIKVWYGDKSGMHTKQHLADSIGEVSLTDLPSHGAWIFVRADGFQTTGSLVEPGTPQVDITLIRNEESQSLTQRVGWADVSDSSERAVKILLGRTVKRILEGTDERLKFQGLLLLARHNAESALDLHGKYAIDFAAIGNEQDLSDFTDTVIRSHRCAELVLTNPTAADQLLRTIKDGYHRALGYTECIKALASASEEKPAENPWIQSWIKLANQSVEAEKEPHWRAECLAGLARTLFDSGDTSERAKRALEDAQVALKIPSENERWFYAHSAVAWELARYDVEAAMRLVQSEIDSPDRAAIKGSQDKKQSIHNSAERESKRGRLFGNLAHQIALTDSVRAALVLDACPGEYREMYCPRVCYRIAKLDVERALKLAQPCKTRLARGHSLGAIAAAIADRDRDQALRFLYQAFDELEHVPASEEKFHTAASVACSLLPITAKIDHRLLDSFKWRALAMRSAKQCHSGCRGPVCNLGLVDQTSQLRLSDGLLGATIARYDAQLGRQIAFAAGDDTFDLPLDKAPYFLFGTAFLTAPEQAVLALSALPLDNTEQQRVVLSALEQVVGMVGLTEAERWDWLFDEQYQLWRPDKFDF